MQIIIGTLHVLVCIVLILVVLLQTGKGANMGAAFGGSSQTVFGSSGPGSFLGKMTTVVATVFMLTSLWLAYFAVHKNVSVIDQPPTAGVEQTIPAGEGEQSPAVPAVPAPEPGTAE